MELEQLRHFVKVAEHGAFSRTAAVLGISQPLLSRQIRGLEVELRKTLFHRHGRGIALTDAGEHFLAIARNVIQELDFASQTLANTESEISGRFVLGLPPSMARVLTLRVVRSFSAAFPRAKLAVVEGLSRNLHEGLIADRLDAALVHDQSDSGLIAIEPFGTDQLCLITKKGEEPDAPALPFPALSRLPLIFPCAPNPLRSIVEEQARRSNIKLDIAYEIDGVETILEMVEEGFGYTIAASTAVRAGRFTDVFTAIPLADPGISTVISLATSRRRPRTALHSRTIEILRDVFSQVQPTH